MGGAPAGHLLQLKEHLKLTDEQVKRLETLNTSQMLALAPNPGVHLRAQADMADAMQGEGNLVAARAAMEKMAKIRTDGAIAHMQAMRDARALLTADQKAAAEKAWAARMALPTTVTRFSISAATWRLCWIGPCASARLSVCR